MTRDDLADRVLMAQLLEITEDKRLPQAELNAKVEEARPRILGALLTALSQTLAAIPNTKPKTLPRMADYALFAMASEAALGLKPGGLKLGTFREIFDESREQSRKVVIESSPVGEAIVRLMEKRLIWKGTTSELLNELENHTDAATYRSRYFPKASNGLSRQLTRLTPDLRALGILVSDKNTHGTKRLTLEKEIKVSPSSPPNQSKSSHSNDLEGGDKGGGNFEGGDNCEVGDKGGDKKTAIPTPQTDLQQAIHDLGDDGDGKNSLFSKVLEVGDRVKYIGGMLKYKGARGKVVKAIGDRYQCDFVKGSIETIPATELEAIS